MREARRPRIAATWAVACALAAIAGPAPVASGAELTRHSIVGDCFAFQAPDGFVAKASGGYVATAARAQAEPFRLQATDLATYLLYGEAGDFLTLDGNDAESASQPSRAAEWRAHKPSSRGFAFTNLGSGSPLSVAADGRVGAGGLTEFELVRTRGCAHYPEIGLNTQGQPFTGKTRYGEVRGFWDPHMHIMAFEAFGGGVHCGRPWHRYGVTHALPDCAETEGPAGLADPAKNFVNWGLPAFPHDTVGWPTFRDWPNHHSLTYEQTYYKWLERSWMGGLRLAVNLLVDNRAFCVVLAQPQHRRNPCNEMETVRREAKAIYEMQDYIDAQSGGPGKGFFRIVRNPFEARKVINDGKLAVVLGIEISELFGCTRLNDVPQCDKADVDRSLDEVYRMGVRDMELLNKFDNAFVGVRFDSDTFGLFVNGGNALTTGKFWRARTCTGPEADNTIARVPPISDPIFDTPLAGVLSGLPLYPSPPHCNVIGMTPLGEYLVRKMIRRGMIVDPDHMSVTAANRALEILAREKHSGVVSSHSWTDERNWPDIYRLGGVVAPKAGSSTGFIENWREARKMRDRRYYFGFGFGDDMNGFATQGPPRTGAENPVRYPFESFDGGVRFDRQRSGERVFDINADGVAHFGLYPDWVEDLRKQAGGRIVRDLSRGAEAYLQMWERAVGVPRERCLPQGAKLTAKGLGQLRIGDTAKEVLLRAGQPDRRVGRTYRYCVRGSKGKVTAKFTRRGRLARIELPGR
jgi:hypothetical protein